MKKKNTTKEIIDTRNTVSSTELEQILRTQIESIMKDNTLVSKLPPILIHGSPGLGKSSIVKGIAEELGIGFVDVRLAQMEPCDIKGLPVPDNENKVMQWYINGTWPRDPNSKGIVFLDEIKSCDRSIQVASYELILDRKLGDTYKIPDGWVVIAAGNNAGDRAVATTMSSALANRFMHLELNVNTEDWTLWAQHNGIHPSIIGFINYRNEYLFHMEGENLERGWPSPRSWERVSHILDLYKDNIKSPIVRKLIYGLVGNSVGVEFMEFLNINSQFDNILEIMRDPKKKIVIPEREDAKYAMVSSMVYLLWKGEDEDDQNERIDGFYRICMELPPDFTYMAMMAAIAGDNKSMKEKYVKAIFYHPMNKKWSEKFGKSLKKRIVI
jgi:hypothetical protein